MPPSRRSSSSRSSRSSSSRSRSRSSSSRRRSSSSHSSSYSSSYRRSHSGSSGIRTIRSRSNQPRKVPSHIRSKAVMMRCKNHDYMYYNESWQDETTGTLYRKGYYDENGTYYDADNIVFKKPDGSYEAHYKCDYCGTDLETNWKEGFYPTCKNCGAEMNKTPVFVDEILDLGSVQNRNTGNAPQVIKKLLLSYVGASLLVPIIFLSAMFSIFRGIGNESQVQEDAYVSETVAPQLETNLELFGVVVYLDEVSENTYRICSAQDDYEKYISWNYSADAYYDSETDCYLWYNTDVSPNLWQYWYDDIAGDNYYGWMECEGDDWYIEVSDTDWKLYEGDTSKLWHIENEFDK